MEELLRVGGESCADHGEYPFGQGRLPKSPPLSAIAERHGVTPFEVALASVLRYLSIIAIPKSADLMHVEANRHALELRLTVEDHAMINAEFPPTAQDVPRDDLRPSSAHR